MRKVCLNDVRRPASCCRYLRLIREHQRRLNAVMDGSDHYPRDLVRLELIGIALGPLAYIISMAQQGRSPAR